MALCGRPRSLTARPSARVSAALAAASLVALFAGRSNSWSTLRVGDGAAAALRPTPAVTATNSSKAARCRWLPDRAEDYRLAAMRIWRDAHQPTLAACEASGRYSGSWRWAGCASAPARRGLERAGWETVTDQRVRGDPASSRAMLDRTSRLAGRKTFCEMMRRRRVRGVLLVGDSLSRLHATTLVGVVLAFRPPSSPSAAAAVANPSRQSPITPTAHTDPLDGVFCSVPHSTAHISDTLVVGVTGRSVGRQASQLALPTLGDELFFHQEPV